jgi:LPXTG-motif cell wall-anchored protein
MKKLLGLFMMMLLGACMAVAQQPAAQDQTPQQSQPQTQQQQQPAAPGQQGVAGQQTLPQTASPLPLIMVLGLGAIGSGAAMRLRRREVLEN